MTIDMTEATGLIFAAVAISAGDKPKELKLPGAVRLWVRSTYGGRYIVNVSICSKIYAPS